MTAHYIHGDATLLVSHENAVLLPACTKGLRDELWSLLAADTCAVVDLLDVLTRGGIGSMGDFTAVLVQGTEVVTLSRGSCQIILESRSGEQLDASGRGVSTWAERRFPREELASLALTASGAPAEGESMPLDRGVVLASQATFRADGVGRASSFDSLQAQVVEPVPVQVPDAEPEPSPDAAEQLVDAPAVDPEPAPSTPEAADAEATLVESDDSMDHLWGATVARSPEDAAVRVVEPAAGAPLITGVPGSAPAREAGDHDGLTVSRSALSAMRSGRKQSTAVEPQAPRVPVATLQLTDGTSVLLDRPVYVGRAPKALNNTSSYVPKLVTVVSPQGFVSSTHVEFHLEDDNILVRDVSRNGTLLLRPDGEPERLTQGVLTLVSDGCVIDLGDEITIRVTSVER